jgi:hypothetical protein
VPPKVEEDDLPFGGGELLWCAVERAVGEVACGLGQESQMWWLHVGSDPVLEELEDRET